MSGRLARTLVCAALLSVIVVSSGQAALSTNTWVPSSFTFFDQCTGENVAVSGDVHVLVTSGTSGTNVAGTFHSDFQATGIGQSSGLKYEEHVVANSSFTASLINGEATFTFVGRITITAPGANNNQTSPIYMHTTVNANGDVTSNTIDAPTIFCR